MPRHSHVAHAAPLGTDTKICDTVRLGGVGDCTLSAAKLNAPHRPDVELRIIEQRQMNLPAHRGDVGLLDDQLGSAPPASAQVNAIFRQSEHVVARIRDRAQGDPPIVGRGRVSFLKRYAGGNITER